MDTKSDLILGLPTCLDINLVKLTCNVELPNNDNGHKPLKNISYLEIINLSSLVLVYSMESVKYKLASMSVLWYFPNQGPTSNQK
jgi:hypothetical protein